MDLWRLPEICLINILTLITNFEILIKTSRTCSKFYYLFHQMMMIDLKEIPEKRPQSITTKLCSTCQMTNLSARNKLYQFHQSVRNLYFFEIIPHNLKQSNTCPCNYLESYINHEILPLLAQDQFVISLKIEHQNLIVVQFGSGIKIMLSHHPTQTDEDPEVKVYFIEMGHHNSVILSNFFRPTRLSDFLRIIIKNHRPFEYRQLPSFSQYLYGNYPTK